MARRAKAEPVDDAVPADEDLLAAAPEPADDLSAVVSVGDLIDRRRPAMDSPDWSDWVVAQLTPDELDPQGLPKVGGLARLVEKLLGRIVYSVGRPEQCPQTRDSIAVASYEVRVETPEGLRVYGDTGSCSPDNCKSAMVAAYAVETATTRAQARCLRKMLRLKGIAAEEAGVAEASPGLIELSQVLFIDANCREMDLSVRAFVNAGSRAYRGIGEVRYDTAQLMVEKLGEYRRKPASIPANLRGYDPGWRSSFGGG